MYTEEIQNDVGMGGIINQNLDIQELLLIFSYISKYFILCEMLKHLENQFLKLVAFFV